MTVQPTFRGTVPVATLSEFGAVEIAAIYYLRHWHAGPEAQSEVWNDFAMALGRENGRKTLKTFETLCAMCAKHGRRPLLCHNIPCKCVGADESCFAHFVGYAAEGAREDAMLVAVNLIRPDMAFVLVGLAEEFGLALKRMTLRLDVKRRAAPKPVVIH